MDCCTNGIYALIKFIIVPYISFPIEKMICRNVCYISGPRKSVFSAVYLPCEMTTPPPKLSPTLPMLRKTLRIRACGGSHGRKPLQWLY